MILFILCFGIAITTEYIYSHYLENKFNILLILSILLPLSEMYKQITLFRHNGHYDWWYFPFQLCSLIMYLLPVKLLFKNDVIEQYIDSFLIDFGLVGGVAVFLDQSGLNYYSPALTIHSYAWHTIMIFTALYISRNIDPQKFSFIKGSVVYIIGIVTATLINILFNSKGMINMFYISPFLEMEQIVFKQLAALTTQPIAKIAYIISTLTGAYIIHRLILTLKKT